MDISDKIIEVLEDNNIKPFLSGNPEFLGTIRIYESEVNIDKLINELEFLFKNYSSYSITLSHINSCCAPSYEEIRYKVEK